MGGLQAHANSQPQTAWQLYFAVGKLLDPTFSECYHIYYMDDIVSKPSRSPGQRLNGFRQRGTRGHKEFARNRNPNEEAKRIRPFGHRTVVWCFSFVFNKKVFYPGWVKNE